MGATNFENVVELSRFAKDADSAFMIERNLHSSAEGYSGTIREKCNFIMVSTPKLPTVESARRLAASLTEYSKFDKYGPAGCIAYRRKGGRKIAGWVFFGIAAC